MASPSRRGKVKGKPRHYVRRGKRGRFKKWTRVGRGLAVDRRRRVGHRRIPKTRTGRPKSGYGHIGDYPRRRRKRRR